MGHAIPTLHDPTLFIEKSRINGQLVSASSGEVFTVYDPATGSAVGDCPDLSSKDAEAAIAAATAAFSTFSKTTSRLRAGLLRQWLNHVRENAKDIAILITWESGKALGDAIAEVEYAASYIEWFAEEGPRLYGDTIPASGGSKRIMTVREPIGVCALITPWNFPAAMLTRKIAPALAVGCTIVLKSAGETPFTANALVELARRAGLPDGVLNVVTTLKYTIDIGRLFSTDDRIKKVSFTGSTQVGKLLMAQSAGTLKKLSLELGGNSPFIIFDDCADLDEAITGAITAKFRGCGQTCVAANRIFVQAGIYDKFTRLFTEAVERFHVGHGFDENVTHGPLITARAVDKVHGHVEDALRKGAKLLTGGRRLIYLGENFYAPTVLEGVTGEMSIFREESFGPLAGLSMFSTEKEVIELANKSEVGLAAYIFTKDISRMFRVSEALEVGMVGINTGIISDAAAPFGGIKESGFGREGSKFGLEDYTTLKTITMSVSMHS